MEKSSNSDLYTDLHFKDWEFIEKYNIQKACKLNAVLLIPLTEEPRTADVVLGWGVGHLELWGHFSL